MKKTNYFILLSVLFIGIIAMSVYFIINFDNFGFGNGQEESEELKQYKKIYSLELINDEYYIITGLKDQTKKQVDIPNTIDNLPVRKIIDSINENFISFKNVNTINIPSNVSYIGISKNDDDSYGKNVFLSASSLTTINVDKNNEKYQSINGILYSKDQKTLVRYPSARSTEGSYYEIPSNVEVIYQYAFSFNSAITKVILGTNVSEIQANAFYNCKMLFAIEFNDSLKKIGDAAFQKCISLKKVVLPVDLEFLGSNSFNSCVALTDVTIYENINEFGKNIFTGSLNLVTIYTNEAFIETIIGMKSTLGLSSKVNIKKIEN